MGHFFFWYLRSEVAGCPFFRQRMAVILEAYLLGCGEAMLTSFQSQVQVVKILHEVANRVKSLYPEKSTLSPLGNKHTIPLKSPNKMNGIVFWTVVSLCQLLRNFKKYCRSIISLLNSRCLLIQGSEQDPLLWVSYRFLFFNARYNFNFFLIYSIYVLGFLTF